MATAFRESDSIETGPHQGSDKILRESLNEPLERLVRSRQTSLGAELHFGDLNAVAICRLECFGVLFFETESLLVA